MDYLHFFVHIEIFSESHETESEESGRNIQAGTVTKWNLADSDNFFALYLGVCPMI